MSAKKKEKIDWSYCETCESHYPRNVLAKHQKICADQSLSADDSLNSNVPVNSGFVEGSIFHGLVKPFQFSQDARVPKRCDLISIHPCTLKFCNLQVGCSVLLKYGMRHTFGTIWPSSSVPVDGVCMQIIKMKSLQAEEGTLIELIRIECTSIIANQVLLEPVGEGTAENFDQLSDFMLHELDDTNITCGDVVTCSYYGDERYFRIVEISGDLGIKSASELDYLEEGFHQLSLAHTETSIQQVSSTPLKNEKTKNYYSSVISKTFIYNVMFNETKLNVVQTGAQIEETESCSQSDIDKIGGLETQKKMLKELIELPFQYSDMYSSCGVSTSKGIIFYGPSGTGKTVLAHAFVKMLPNIYSVTVNGPELTSKFYGETEQKLRDVFSHTLSKAPSILIIDEFDTLCPIRSSSSNESERRVISTLVTLMDNVGVKTPFAAIAITSNIEAVDLALRRPGRFEQEIEVGVPNVRERLDILQKLLSDCKHSIHAKDIVELSEITHGYVGADLNALCKEAGMLAMKRVTEHIKSNHAGCVESLDSFAATFSLTINDLQNALCKVGPSAMKAVMVDIPKVFWKDVGGQNLVKQKLKEAIEWPLKHPEVFQRLGITPPRGLLMYGPPGCSKTLMAKALATESGLNFISIKGPELFNKYLGESERAVRDVFHKARVTAPSIIFFDEIDAIGVQRSGKESGSNNVADRVLAQILTELDGVESLNDVIVVAATNRPDIIDPALLRPGRIDRLIYVPLPDVGTRKEIFEIQFRSIPVYKDVSIEALLSLSSGYSGAEICSLCREAALLALRENFECNNVMQKHFEIVFKEIKPATSKLMITFYEDFVTKTTGTF